MKCSSADSIRLWRQREMVVEQNEFAHRRGDRYPVKSANAASQRDYEARRISRYAPEK